MPKKKKHVKDAWRGMDWYKVVSPPYFGGVELGALPADAPQKIVGRTVEATLYEITNDFTHQNLKIYFKVTDVEGKTASSIFRGHEYSRDYLRSLVRRKTTRVDGVFDVTTKDGYKLRLSTCAFTLHRIRTSQEQSIRALMKKVVEEKAISLTFQQFVQELVLGKIASDVYNEAKNIAPLRHLGVRKSKLIFQPTTAT